MSISDQCWKSKTSLCGHWSLFGLCAFFLREFAVMHALQNVRSVVDSRYRTKKHFPVVMFVHNSYLTDGKEICALGDWEWLNLSVWTQKFAKTALMTRDVHVWTTTEWLLVITSSFQHWIYVEKSFSLLTGCLVFGFFQKRRVRALKT